MQCCDQETIALYINADLGEAEAQLVNAHLAACPTCRLLAAVLRADAQALAATLAAEPIPALMLTPPGRRWLPAATAVALGLALLVGIASGPASADGIQRALRWFTVRTFTQQDLIAWNKQTANTPEKVLFSISPQLSTLDPAAAEKLAGYHLLRPTYLPQGFTLDKILVWPTPPDHPWHAMQQVYSKWKVRCIVEIAQSPEGPTDGIVEAPQADLQEVMVGGDKGLLVHGYITGSPGAREWLKGPVTLYVHHNGQVIRITSGNETIVSGDELIRIAESLR